jgi:hypothetical protein
MRALAALTLLCVPITLVAPQEPERFSVRAGFVPIDDGSYHVVILTDVKSNGFPTFCGPGWSGGMILTEAKDAFRPQSIVTNPAGCWSATNSDPKGTLTFRYLDLSNGSSVKEFKIDASMTRRMIYEWRTERLFPAS